ncbi:unnamed protein product [Ectocarpus sp. CCAP 1310/34]|nr:unnamed protein product [Ectocarpus sp. CCAP 1310/34]
MLMFASPSKRCTRTSCERAAGRTFDPRCYISLPVSAVIGIQAMDIPCRTHRGDHQNPEAIIDAAEK